MQEKGSMKYEVVYEVHMTPNVFVNAKRVTMELKMGH